MTRDFSEQQKQNLLNMVKEVQPDNFFQGLGDWFGDKGLCFSHLIGNLNINKYLNDLDSFHRKMIDKDDMSARKINTIFTNVHNVDSIYSQYNSSAYECIVKYSDFMCEYSSLLSNEQLSLNSQAFVKRCGDTFQKAAKSNFVLSNNPKLYNESDNDFGEKWEWMNDGIDAGVSGGIIALSKLLKIPEFTVWSKNPAFVTIKSSIYNHLGRGGTRLIKIETLKSGVNEFSSAYKIGTLLKKVDKALPWVLAGVSGIVSAVDEYNNGEYETQTERVVDAVVEGAYSFGVGLASAKVGSMIGAAVGSVIPGAGTVAGAAVGAAVGFVGGILVTAVADTLTHKIKIGDKTAIQWVKDGANAAATGIGNAIGKINDTANAVKDTFSGFKTGLCGIGKAVFGY